MLYTDELKNYIRRIGNIRSLSFSNGNTDLMSLTYDYEFKLISSFKSETEFLLLKEEVDKFLFDCKILRKIEKNKLKKQKQFIEIKFFDNDFHNVFYQLLTILEEELLKTVKRDKLFDTFKDIANDEAFNEYMVNKVASILTYDRPLERILKNIRDNKEFKLQNISKEETDKRFNHYYNYLKDGIKIVFHTNYKFTKKWNNSESVWLECSSGDKG